MILEKNKPFLSEKIITALSRYKENKNIIFKTSKDDLFVPVVNNISLHSQYFPLKEGAKTTSDFPEENEIIAIGFGAGYHLYELAKKHRIISVCIDENILSSVLEKIDLTNFFRSENLKIILPEEITEHFDFYQKKGYNFILHPVYEKIFPKKIKKTVIEISSRLKSPLLELNTQRMFGKLWLENIFRNIKLLFENKFDYTPLTLHNKPVLICGAGYSLHQNIDLIKKNKDLFFITAADTALKVLIKSEIIPDAVFSFDSQNYSYLHFAGLKKIPRLFIDFCSGLKLPARQTLLFSNHPMINIFNIIKMEPITLSSNTRNIGGAIIDFFKKYFPEHLIITAGIDYAVYLNNLYSKGTYLNESFNINANYYKSGNFHDSKLLYRERITEEKNGWKTNALLKSYSDSLISKDNIFTLSGSPFSIFKKINILDDIFVISEKTEEKTLLFKKPPVSKKIFMEIMIEEFSNQPEILLSYFLSIKKEPAADEIKKIIKKAESIIC